jgi:hypothetical protein
MHTISLVAGVPSLAVRVLSVAQTVILIEKTQQSFDESKYRVAKQNCDQAGFITAQQKGFDN